MDKLKRVKVSTPDGVKYVMFRPVTELPTDRLICDDYCPYEKICGKLPDPRDPGNKELCFTDFCNTLGEGDDEDEKLVGMVPVEGELENLFKDNPNFLKELIEKENPVYKLSSIIDKCCPGMCEYYSSNYEYCTLKNKMCILRGLLVGESFKKKGNNDNKE